jgi:hypothetical protein
VLVVLRPQISKRQFTRMHLSKQWHQFPLIPGRDVNTPTADKINDIESRDKRWDKI